mmetsp:Transcript_54387/g.115505  ORF Transcript_54387/g.115505 Transcript_54387/m.115505 type:complete len:222 (+) Transcript_54387:588-1253(+)
MPGRTGSNTWNAKSLKVTAAAAMAPLATSPVNGWIIRTRMEKSNIMPTGECIARIKTVSMSVSGMKIPIIRIGWSTKRRIRMSHTTPTGSMARPRTARITTWHRRCRRSNPRPSPPPNKNNRSSRHRTPPYPQSTGPYKAWATRHALCPTGADPPPMSLSSSCMGRSTTPTYPRWHGTSPPAYTRRSRVTSVITPAAHCTVTLCMGTRATSPFWMLWMPMP